MNPRLALVLLALACGAPLVHAGDNELTAAEKAAGWQLLFDGKSFAGWRGYRMKTGDAVPGWEIKDGTLAALPHVRGKELITEKTFNDFELTWDWCIALAGNNGVKYFVTEARPGAPGHEYQMIDDANHPDGKIGPHRQTAAFYDVIPAPLDKPLRAPGEWNTSKIVVRGNHVEHWLNGRQVLAYELGSPEVKAGLARSKFRNQPGFGDKIAGHIMLTYHGDACRFRNIKLREL